MRVNGKKAISLIICFVLVFTAFGCATGVNNRISAQPSIGYSLDSSDSYDVVIGNDKLLKDVSEGFTIGKGTAILEKSSIIKASEYIDCFSFDMTVLGTVTKQDYFTVSFITSFVDKDNYSFLRLTQTNGNQTYINYTVDNGKTVCHNDNQVYKDESMLDFSEPVTVMVDKTAGTYGNFSVYQNSDNEMGFVHHKVKFKKLSSEKTLVALSNLSGSHTLKFSEIHAAPLSMSVYSANARERKNFWAQYSELIAMAPYDMTVNYKSAIENATAAYSEMSEYNQTFYLIEGKRLELNSKKVRELISAGAAEEPEIQPGDNYYKYSNDFSNASKDFVNAITQPVKYEIVEESENGYLKMNKENGFSAIVLKNYKIPKGTSLSTVSYKMKLSQFGTYVPARFVLGYKDPNNYQYLKIEYNPEKRYQYSFVSVENGTENVRNNELFSTTSTEGFDITDWSDISITYTGKSAQIICRFGEATISLTFNLDYISNRFALANCATDITLYDDLQITYEKFTDDVLSDNDSIKVYYTGNTEQYPNDTVIISGNNIYENISSLRIKQIANTDSSAASYIKATWYDTDEYEGEFIHSSAPDYSEEYWEDAVNVEIIQPTVNSIKFLIPSSFSKGMYAVRLNGFDYNSSNDDVIVYINRPRVSFTQGNEGKIATKGGFLKVVGDMLVWNYDAAAPDISNVKLHIAGSGYSKVLTSESLVAENANCLQFEIPSDMKNGVYELSVYNGIGGTDGWSAPVKFNVGDSPRESWPATVYNVKSFGASGKKYENATGAVVKALEALSLNGGGILYFPEGQYNLCAELYVPENVVFKGDGSGKSIVFWSEDMFPIGKLPSAFVHIKRNVAFENLGFYSSRVGSWFSSIESDVKNIYFEHCYIYTNPYAQVVTGASQGAWGAYRYNNAELTAMIMNEVNSKVLINLPGGDLSEDGAQNVRIYDTEIRTHFQANGQQRTWNYVGDYFYVNGVKTNGNWSTSLKGSATVFENSSFENGAVSALAIGMYVYNNSFGPTTDNNRELWVADYPNANAVTLKLRTDYNNKIPGYENCWYEVLGKQFGDDLIRYWQFKVVRGDGSNQVRYVVKNIGNIVCLNSPFATPVTSDSYVIMREGRQDGYFVDNSLYNGGAGLGWYSGVVGLVMTGNTYRKAGNYLCSQGHDTIWYVTMDNADFNDPYMFGGYGYATGVNLMITNDDGGYTSLHLSSGNYQPPGALFAFTVRRSSFSNGSYIDFLHNMGTDTARCILIEDNSFDGVSSPIIFWGSKTLYDGALIRNNSFTNIANMPQTSPEKNSYNANRILALNEKETSGGAVLQKGDVNGDGKVTLKDVTCIRLYLENQMTLSGAAFRRADVNSSGSVTLKDAVAIKYYIIYGVWDLNYIDISDSNEGFFNGNW